MLTTKHICATAAAVFVFGIGVEYSLSAHNDFRVETEHRITNVYPLYLGIEICSGGGGSGDGGGGGSNVAAFTNMSRRDPWYRSILGFLDVWRGYETDSMPPVLTTPAGRRNFFLVLHETLHALGFVDDSFPLIMDIWTGERRDGGEGKNVRVDTCK